MTLVELNGLAASAATEELLRCCGSRRWAARITSLRPFLDPPALFEAADREWHLLAREDWLEAFSRHPRIGDRSGSAWSRQEQGSVTSAADETLRALSAGNADYEKRFGHVYLVCATGKSADEMLALLRARIVNEPATELINAAAEQAKITRIRLEKLLS